MATTKKTATKTAKTVKKAAPKPAVKKPATKSTKKPTQKPVAKKKDNNKIKYIILAAILALLLLGGAIGAMTWARYATEMSGDASIQVAKWAVAMKGNGSTLTNDFDLTLTPSNSHTQVATGKIAPGSTATGTFEIDFTGSEVSTEYTVSYTVPSTLAAKNAEITVTEGGTALSCTGTTTKTCTGYLSLSQVQTAATAKKTITVTVNWGDNGGYFASNDDEDDTSDGKAAGTITIPITLSAKQSFDHTF